MDDADSSSEDETILSITDQVNDFDYSHKDCGLLLGNNYQCPVLGHGTIKATVTINGAT
jgi:hypothetical protein